MRFTDVLGGAFVGAVGVYFIGIALPPVVLFTVLIAGVSMILRRRVPSIGSQQATRPVS
jgi:hypothetical protein